MSETSTNPLSFLTPQPGPETHGYPVEALALFATPGNDTPTPQETRMHELVAAADFHLDCGIVMKERAVSAIREAYPKVLIEENDGVIRFREFPDWARSAEHLLQKALIAISEADPPQIRQDDPAARRYFAAHP